LDLYRRFFANHQRESLLESEVHKTDCCILNSYAFALMPFPIRVE
jgi:hypothetical protein